MQKHKKARYRIWLECDSMEILLHTKELCVEDKQHHYLARVVRLKEGDYIECMAQSGIIATAQIHRQMKTSSTLLLHTYSTLSPPTYSIILALGASKQIRRSFLLEKCVELCLHEVWIWRGEHSQVDETIHNSWYEVLYNSATQCGNPFIPMLRSFSSLNKMLAYAIEQKTKQLFFYEDIQQSKATHYTEWNASLQPLVLIIGCEGGFSHNEVSLLHAHNIPCRSLGSTRLRFETAGIVASSMAVMLNDSKGIAFLPNTP